MPYTFTLLDTSEVNAFAVPGGFIYVTRGMLDFVHDDDELAAVIGHELAHVARRHGAEQLEALAVAEAGARWLLDREPRLEDIYDTEEGAMATEMTAVLLLNGRGRRIWHDLHGAGRLRLLRRNPSLWPYGTRLCRRRRRYTLQTVRYASPLSRPGATHRRSDPGK